MPQPRPACRLSHHRARHRCRQQGLYRTLRVLDGEAAGARHVRPPFGRQPVVEQLPRPDDASEAAAGGARRRPRVRRRLGVRAHDRRHDGDPHGARAPAGGVQADRGRGRLPERLRRQRRHGRRRCSTKDDVIISDELNHASIIDGCRLSRAPIKVFPHKDVAAARADPRRGCPADQRKLLITDGVFSMDGDLGALPELCDARRRVRLHHDGRRRARQRRVRPERPRHVDHFDCHGRVDIQVGTLSKAIGALGGYVAGTHDFIDVPAPPRPAVPLLHLASAGGRRRLPRRARRPRERAGDDGAAVGQHALLQGGPRRRSASTPA